MEKSFKPLRLIFFELQLNYPNNSYFSIKYPTLYKFELQMLKKCVTVLQYFLIVNRKTFEQLRIIFSIYFTEIQKLHQLI